MRIAIVAPSPIPFTLGGAEMLFLGMQNSINKSTSHQCELIKIPIKEDNFWNLIDAYYQFHRLDLSYFDMVISTKYPAWMLKHHNHTIYMVHHLRGLFDTYNFCNEAYEVEPKFRTGLVEEILDLVHSGDKTERNVEKIFEKLFELKEEQKKYNKEIFKFPGPFIREIIHFFDEYALSPVRINRYLTMSNNVKKRTDYFPLNVQIDVNYPPSKIENFECNAYNYLLTASRLDGPKRIDLLVQAMRHVPHNVKLKIVGTGPEEERLKKMAENDHRIEFYGFVSEEELVRLYSNSLAVLYVPYDEDYGLITIEGMMSKKPIITAKDSGGPLEFVKDSETGYIVEPEPKKIAEKINYLFENQEIARIMGNAAYEQVNGISWRNFAFNLVGQKKNSKTKKKKILVLSTYSCYPPRGGGQHRLYNLYSLMAKEFDVTICSIIETNKPYQNLTLDNGLRQICIPQSIEHARNQWEAEKKIGVNLYDVTMIDFIYSSKEYVEEVKKLATDSDIIIFSHPYLYKLSSFISEDKIIIYDAIDVEYLQKRNYVRSEELSEKVRNSELEACQKSNIIFATSEEDKNQLIELYSIDPKKVFIVSNGVETSTINLISQEEKMTLKEITGIKTPSILFVGSWHPPNLRALKFIVDNLAKNLKDYIFLVVGSVKDYYLNEYGKLPQNVLAFGVVDEEEKYEIYKIADIAVNPMFSGSGTNLKMLDYMSAGIPVISTPMGSRGLNIENGKHAVICESEEIPKKIVELLKDTDIQKKMRISARVLVEEKYSWRIIVHSIVEKLAEDTSQ